MSVVMVDFVLPSGRSPLELQPPRRQPVLESAPRSTTHTAKPSWFRQLLSCCLFLPRLYSRTLSLPLRLLPHLFPPVIATVFFSFQGCFSPPLLPSPPAITQAYHHFSEKSLAGSLPPASPMALSCSWWGLCTFFTHTKGKIQLLQPPR